MTEQTKQPKTHFVAIIKPIDHYYDYDSYDTVIQSISNWEEVDDETFQLLRDASTYVTERDLGRPFIVIERLTTKSPVVINTVSEYVEYLAQAKAKKEAEAAERKAKASAKALQKLAKDEEARRKLYEQLQKEFNGDAK